MNAQTNAWASRVHNLEEPGNYRYIKKTTVLEAISRT